MGPDGGQPATGPVECAPTDPTGLPPCCEMYGGAHCLPASQVPSDMHADLEACAGGGYCVMDTLIRARFARTPRSCASLSGNPGACVSLCIPQVRENAEYLPQDVCEASERCAPCTNPLTGAPTGICDPQPPLECGATSRDLPDSGPPAPPPMPCCTGRGTCVNEAAVPEDQRSHLDRDTCGETSYCIPNEYIEDPMHVPRSCTISWAEFVGGDPRGGCMSECFPEIRDQSFLSQEDCPDGYKCAPCTDPFSGESTGACEARTM